jgi:hypothetical protein
MTQFYTYLWLREDGTPYYVGKGNGRRAFIHHKTHCEHRPKSNARIFVQYWESEDKAFEMEKWYISLFGRKDAGTGILHNRTDGGQGQAGNHHSDETKEKMRNAQLGKKKTKAHNIANSLSHMGQAVWNKGLKGVVKCSKATREKMSLMRTGKHRSAEATKNIREANTKRWEVQGTHTSEAKQKMREAVAKRDRNSKGQLI